MNRQPSILFIPSSISGDNAGPQVMLSQTGYYGQLIHGLLARTIYTIEGLHSLEKHLSLIARHAYWAKQVETVEQVTELMLGLPIADQFEDSARYYKALCFKQRGDLESARRLLERVAEGATPQYRPRAFQVIGATYFERGDVDASLRFYLEAGKAAVGCDPLTLAESRKMAAVVRSIHGDHKGALADLNDLFPLVRSVGTYYPVLFYDFLNGLAVELAEVGRIEEAQGALSIALASPFASAYPEWCETRDEIAAKRLSATRSVVAINRRPAAAPLTQAESEPKSKPTAALDLSWLAGNDTLFQRTPRIAAFATVPHDETTNRILERVLTCIRSRAPPIPA